MLRSDPRMSRVAFGSRAASLSTSSTRLLCEHNYDEIIKTYMSQGWHSLTKIYKAKKIGKEKVLANVATVRPATVQMASIDDDLLALLGALRKYMFKAYFSCEKTKYAHNENYYIAAGSTDLTSDYDTNIIGRDAPDITMGIYDNFRRLYHTTLPKAFDCNIYCHGMFLNEGQNEPKGYNKIDYTVKLDNLCKSRCDVIDVFTIEPTDVSIKKKTLNYAVIKLLENKTLSTAINTGRYQNINGYYNAAKVLRAKLTYGMDMEDIDKRYKLQCDYIKSITGVLYDNKDSIEVIKGSYIDPDFTDYLCAAKYYSIEPYYTQCTVNVVVIELQLGLKGRFKQNVNYTCSAIENLGDFAEHMGHEIEHHKSPNGGFEEVVFKNIILKYSKYIYRIAYSLARFNPSGLNLEDIAQVVSRRGSGDLNGLNWSSVFYSDKYLTNPGLYVENVCAFFLERINRILK
jgi:hypothetical protein